MSRITIFVLALCLAVSISAQTSQTFSKSFNPQGATSVVLELGNNVTTQTWNESFIKVAMTVQLEVSNTSTLNGLMQAGRYNLQGLPSAAGYVIKCPGMANPVKINGNTLVEKTTYTIYLPASVSVTPMLADGTRK
jgi:hypothetical protein